MNIQKKKNGIVNLEKNKQEGVKMEELHNTLFQHKEKIKDIMLMKKKN